jgi:hypothetical protein
MAEADDMRVWSDRPIMGRYACGHEYTNLLIPPSDAFIGGVQVIVYRNRFAGATFIGALGVEHEAEFPARVYPSIEAAKVALMLLKD